MHLRLARRQSRRNRLLAVPSLKSFGPSFVSISIRADSSSGDKTSVRQPLPVTQDLVWTHFGPGTRSEEHTSELQSQSNLVCRLLLEKKKKTQRRPAPLVHQSLLHSAQSS